MNKYHEILELDIILEQLKSHLILETNINSIDNLSPYSNVSEVRTALEEVDEAVVITMRMGRVPFYFKNDITFALAKCTKDGVLQIKELMDIEKFLDTVKGIPIYLQSLASNQIRHEMFAAYTNDLYYPKELNLRIKDIVSPFGEINDSASSLLKDIRRKIKDTEKNIQTKLQSIMNQNASKLTQSIISIRNDRYVLPVKNEYKNTFKGIVHDQSASGETFFIEPLIICELNNNLNNLFEKEKQEIYRILKEISLEIGNHYHILKNDYKILKHVDMVFGKAQYAIKIDGAKPKVNDKNYLELYNCKHPLLNVEKVIRNNVFIGKEYKGIIITGPNTGGKTVLMKTVGLLSLMVKYGLLIPSDENSDIMIFDDVYADIGDDQSIAQNLSTFSSHLRNIITILNNVTSNSLVLLDELGSGTDPVEGSSLAIAVFDYLLEKNCLVIASSHYSELKVHAFETHNIINASVEFDPNTLRPTYKLLLGVPGASNALNISKMLGLHPEIIDRAFNHANLHKNEVAETLAKLTDQSAELENRLQSISKLEESLKEKETEILDLKEQIQKERTSILKDAEEKAKAIINSSSKKIDELLTELTNMKNREVKQHEIADAKFEFRQLKESLHIEEAVPVDLPIEINSQVFIESYQCYGIVVKEKKNNKFDVQMGNAIVTIDKAQLKPVKMKTVEKPKSNTKISISQPKNIGMRLDLRGERYESAKERLDKYLDDAVYCGLQQVTIIHGFGTGVIRELVKKTLHNNPLVESYRYGGDGEGGQGATIVSLKK